MRGKELILGDLRGSLAGLTASRNASGSFLRQRVSPVQPATLAQLRAKSTFGAIAPLYRSLSGTDRGTWNNFAKGNYSPKNNSNRGQYTGQMAFQAIQTSYLNSVGIWRSYNVLVDGIPAPSGEVPEPFVGSTPKAPLLPSSASLRDTSGNSVPLRLVAGSVEADGTLVFSLQVGNGAGVALDNFVNSFGDKVGMAVFISSSNPADQMYYRNKEKYLMGYFKHPEFGSIADIANVQQFTFDTSDIFDTSVYQGFPIGGSYVLFSVYLVSIYNQMNLIGRVETQVIGVP